MLFDTVDNVYDVIRIATGVLSTIKIREDRMLKGEGGGGGLHEHTSCLCKWVWVGGWAGGGRGAACSRVCGGGRGRGVLEERGQWVTRAVGVGLPAPHKPACSSQTCLLLTTRVDLT